MSTKVRPRKFVKEVQSKTTCTVRKPDSGKSDLESTSSHRSGSSVSSSDESKSEFEPALKERRRRPSKKVMMSAGQLQTVSWCTLIATFWLLDVGRNCIRVFLPRLFIFVDGSILAAYMHIAYNIIVPVSLYKLWENSPSRVSSSLMFPVLAVFTVASSIQIVTETVITKLSVHGFGSELSVEENTLMQLVTPRELVEVFETIVHVGTSVGQFLWWISFFLLMLFYFASCFIKKSSKIPEGREQLTSASWIIVLLLALYLWYIIAEYQLLWPFLLIVIIILIYQSFELSRHRITDINGQLLLQSLGGTVVFLATWKFLLWGDNNLDKLYPGMLDIAQPWTYVKMYICNN